MNKKLDMTLYAITDSAWRGDNTLESQVELAAKGGITMLQYREKQLSYEDMKREALEVKSVCDKYNIPLIINDNVELAQEIDAAGVHVGQTDMSVANARNILGADKIIGATAKTVSQAIKAQSEGADYLGSGAVFGSNTKKDAIPMSVDILDEICGSVDIPVVAIGGITEENIVKLFDTRMAGVAVVSGIFAAENIEETTVRLKKMLSNRKTVIDKKY